MENKDIAVRIKIDNSEEIISKIAELQEKLKEAKELIDSIASMKIVPIVHSGRIICDLSDKDSLEKLTNVVCKRLREVGRS
ncbi:MAG TPA: hypothetical protein DIT32_03590 [Peptococcaceae bacterium]|nr:hypothetical protein [Peptococcaceae bacterium]